MNFRDGDFVVSVCENGHVLLEVLDDDGKVAFVATMSGVEASVLAQDLSVAVQQVAVILRPSKDRP